jgi:hypothetical protein
MGASLTSSGLPLGFVIHAALFDIMFVSTNIRTNDGNLEFDVKSGQYQNCPFDIPIVLAKRNLSTLKRHSPHRSGCLLVGYVNCGPFLRSQRCASVIIRPTFSRQMYRT